MHSFISEEKNKERERESIFIRPLWHKELSRPGVSQKKLNKLMEFERQHPFLQSELLMKSYKPVNMSDIDFEKLIRLNLRGLSLRHAYKKLGESEIFKRKCCQNIQERTKDFDQWNFKEQFKQMEGNIPEQNEIINLSSISQYIDDCFHQSQPPPTNKYSLNFRAKRLSVGARSGLNSPTKKYNRNELFQAIQTVKYSDLFSGSAHLKQVEDKLDQIKDSPNKTELINDIIQFLDQDLSKLKQRRKQQNLQNVNLTQPLSPIRGTFLPKLNINDQETPLASSIISPRVKKTIEQSESLKQKKQIKTVIQKIRAID